MPDANTSWPNIRSRIRGLIDDKALIRARKIADDSENKWPENAELIALQAEIRMRLGKPRQAKARFQKAKKIGLPAARADRLGLNVSLANNDAKAAIKFGHRLLAREVKLTMAECLGIVRSQEVLEHWNSDPAFWNHLFAMCGQDSRLLEARYTALLMSRPPEDWAQELESAVFGPNGGPEHVVAFRIIHTSYGKFSAAIADLARRAAETWPDHPMIRKNLYFLKPEAEIRPNETDWGNQTKGEQLESVLKRWSNTANFEDFLMAPFKTQLSPEGLKRGLLLNDPKKELQISPVGTSDLAIIVVAGLGDLRRIPFDLIDAYFASCGFSGIFLRDSTRTLGLNGFSEIADSYEGTVAALRKIVEDIPGFKRLAIMSTSAGGMAAGNLACDLGAERLLMFSPPTNVTPEFLHDIADIRGRTIQKRLAEIERKDLLDLHKRFQDCPSPPQTMITYSAERPEDRKHAENLGDLDSVELKPLSDSSQHLVLPDYIANDWFLPLLRTLA